MSRTSPHTSPHSSRSRRTRRVAGRAVAAGLAVATLSSLTGLAGLGSTPATAESALRPANEAANVAPPRSPEDPESPRPALRRAAAALERLAAATGNSGLAAARREVLRAEAVFSGEAVGLRPTNLTGTIAPLAAAERALAQARVPADVRRQVDDVARRLAAVGRRIAAGVLDRALAAGVDSADVVRARNELARGDSLTASGQQAGAVGAYGSSLKAAAGTLVFDMATFQQNVRDTFADQTVGYSYSLSKNGVLFSAKGVGLARTGADTAGGGTKQTATREVNLASVSKTITAAAVLKLMEENGLDLDESVGVWLPDEWDVHPTIYSNAARVADPNGLTFRDLLTQKGGLGGNVIGGSTALSVLQAAIEQGTKPADQVYTYQNANFGMFRVIIPAMLGVDIYGDPETAPDVLAAQTYVGYLQDEVFDQGGTLPDCKPDEAAFGAATRAYAFPDDGKKGVDMGDWTLGCGGGGLHLSAYELGRFLARLRFTNEIIGPIWRAHMTNGFLGYMDPADGWSWNNGVWGVYRSHGGDLNYGARGVDTCAMSFPIVVQGLVLINSRGGDYGGYQCTALATAFNNAWVKS